MDHPHIAKGYEHFTETFREMESLCMVMELYPNGSLRQYICDSYDSCTQISPAVRIRWMLELLSAVDFLHQNEIIHRDLKFENLFVDAQANVFLGDFGIARSVAQTAAKTYIGTADTIAPEVIRQEAAYGPAADMFSVGCIWYELICGERPFHGQVMAMLQQILQGKQAKLSQIAPDQVALMAPYAAAVEELMQLDPARRPTARQLMERFAADYHTYVEGQEVVLARTTMPIPDVALVARPADQGLSDVDARCVELARECLQGRQVWRDYGIPDAADFVGAPVQALEVEERAMVRVFGQLGAAITWRQAKARAAEQLFGTAN